METIITAENIETVRESLPCDIAREIEVGCRVFTWQDSPNTQSHTLAVWPAVNRGAYAHGGDASWGDWLETEGCLILGEYDEMGASIYMRPLVGRVCVERGCRNEATIRVSSRDMCCVEHAAKSEEWVVITRLGKGATWCDEEMAEQIENAMYALGYNLEICEPMHSRQAEGTYYRNRQGDLISKDRIESSVYERFRRDLDREHDNLI